MTLSSREEKTIPPCPGCHQPLEYVTRKRYPVEAVYTFENVIGTNDFERLDLLIEGDERTDSELFCSRCSEPLLDDIYDELIDALDKSHFHKA